MAFDIKRTSQFELSSDRNSVAVVIRFTLKAFGKGESREEENAFLTIAADFLLVYRIDDATGLDDTAFKNFAEVNGTYNAWPYWREFVQSITTRMDLPTLTIPVFRIPYTPPKVQQALEAGAPAKE